MQDSCFLGVYNNGKNKKESYIPNQILYQKGRKIV